MLGIGGSARVPSTLPVLAKGPDHHFRCPGRLRLKDQLVGGFSYIRGLAEEVVGGIRHALARPFEIDDGIDGQVRGVNALRTRASSDTLDQDSLSKAIVLTSKF